MRLLIGVMSVLMFIVLVGLGMTNPQTVSVTLWSTTYTDIALGNIIIAALAMGVVFTAIIALVEGTAIRLGNRRLRREIHRLETELHFVRAHPTAGEGTSSAKTTARTLPSASADRSSTDAPAAPVYSARALPTEAERDDDDPYGGGRAV